MNELRVSDFQYGGLAHVFSPPGLRLVDKSVGASPTTSVLIRGSAGTGKTTIAIAIAHAIARSTGGIVLYVATEASLADAVYKGALLRLGENSLVKFDPTSKIPVGSIAVVDLVAVAEEAITSGPAELSQLAIDYAYKMVTSRTGNAPMRAVVIDSLELPEGRYGEVVNRSTLAAFVQALESLGVSPVFVEEVGAGTSERLTFVVDVVLQLALATDADTGALRRRLSVLKSRFSEAQPGPHDMLLDDGVPTVLPDSPSLDFGGERQAVGLVVPLLLEGSGKSVLSINRGALILSRYDVDKLRILRAVRSTPGGIFANVHCGPLITVSAGAGPGMKEVPASSGPAALVWALHAVLAESQPVNGVIFSRLEYLLGQPRFARALPVLLARLTRLGLLVCVHGTDAGLKPIDDLADYTGYQNGHFTTQDERAPIARTYRVASAWLNGVPGFTTGSARNIEQFATLRSALDTAQQKLAEGDLVAAREVLLQGDINTEDPAVQRLRISGALLLDRTGQTNAAKTRLASVKSSSGASTEVLCAVAWAYAEIGAEWEALTMALEGIDQPAPIEGWRQLWHVGHLRYSGVPVTVNAATWSAPLVAGFATRAMAARGALHVADAIIGDPIASRGLSAQRVSRLLADVRLESSKSSDWQDADARYLALEGEADLPQLDRADIAFNRGVICERLADLPGAIELFQKSKSLNPFLEMADERLAALAAQG